jgi:hypothetical protein
MIEGFFELRKPLIYVLKNTNYKDFKDNFLSDRQIHHAKDLCHVLSYFIKPSITLQSQFYTALPESLLFIYQINKKLMKAIKSLEDIDESDEEDVSYFLFILISPFYI